MGFSLYLLRKGNINENHVYFPWLRQKSRGQ